MTTNEWPSPPAGSVVLPLLIFAIVSFCISAGIGWHKLVVEAERASVQINMSGRAITISEDEYLVQLEKLVTPGSDGRAHFGLKAEYERLKTKIEDRKRRVESLRQALNLFLFLGLILEAVAIYKVILAKRQGKVRP